MKTPFPRNTQAAATLAAGLLVIAGTAQAWPDDATRAKREIDTCIAAIAEHADYSDASRVRHEVEVVKRRAVGYKLSIETSIYTDDDPEAIREYATQCIAAGDAEPVRFRFTDTSG